MVMTQEHLLMAIRLATNSFTDQVAKDGSPMLLHSLSVLVRVSRAFPEKCKQYYLICVLSVLHDVLEDTDVTESHIQFFFGDEVANFLCLLTRKKGVKYVDYSQKVLDSKSFATIVKYFDMKDNLERCRWLTGEEAEGIDELIAKAVNEGM